MNWTRLSLADFVEATRSFVDTIWELNLDTQQLFVWHDGARPETQGQVLDLQETIMLYYTQYVYGPDKERWLDAYTPETLRGFLRSGEKMRQLEIRVLGGPFGFEWHEVRWNPLPAGDGLPDRILLFTRNLVDVKRAELVEAAVRSEYDYVIYVETKANSYIMYMANADSGTPLPPTIKDDYDGEMEAYNREFVVEDEWAEITCLMKRENVLRQLQDTGEYVLYCKVLEDGVPRDKKLRYSYYDRKNGVLLLTRTDITVAREKERQKEQLQVALNAAEVANRAKSEFLSRMSHDIRTPMNAIIGLTAIAGAHAADPGRVLDCLRKITGSSKLLLSLINEVLDMSKIESGHLILSEEEFQLNGLFTDLIAIIQPDIDRKRHQLDIHIASVVHEAVVGDVQRIQQVLINILANAIKYTPDGGHILLEITEMPSDLPGRGRYRFMVEDDGIGMKSAFLEQIFEPFERAADERVRAIQGTGLGMAISKNIVSMMNGDICVESELEKGSRFTVTFYLRLHGEQMQDTQILLDLPVLIADDDPVVCEEARACLNGIGMQSQCVYTGGEAVQRVVQAHEAGRDFFAAIVDMRMPDLDGIEVTRCIRKQVGPEVPIIVISAYDSAEYEIEAERAGANGFISKPLFKSKLVHMLKRFALEEVPESVHLLPQADYREKRVLLVEDNLLNREIAEEFLGMTHVMIETAENGKIAVEMVSAAPEGWYNLVFMDVQMPVMDGYTATRAIRALARTDVVGLPIVAMTADAFAEDVLRARDAGMNGHMAKPIDTQQLMGVLKAWLG